MKRPVCWITCFTRPVTLRSRLGFPSSPSPSPSPLSSQLPLFHLPLTHGATASAAACRIHLHTFLHLGKLCQFFSRPLYAHVRIRSMVFQVSGFLLRGSYFGAVFCLTSSSYSGSLREKSRSRKIDLLNSFYLTCYLSVVWLTLTNAYELSHCLVKEEFSTLALLSDSGNLGID